MKNKWPHKIIRDIFRAKESFHKELAKMPFEEKIRILVNLQKLVRDLGRFPRNKQIVWQV